MVASLLGTRRVRPIPGKTVKKISVVTVCLNARDQIRLTLDSVAHQTFRNVEHVVIDGGSKDGTQDIVLEYPVGYFISEKDRGIYDAMDKGARAATGDIMIFLNAGDVFFDARTCADVAAFFDASHADIVFGNLLPVYLHPTDSHDHSAFCAGKLLDLGYVRNRRQLYDESIHHQATFYRRWVLERCSYLCSAPEANGEYNVLLNAVMKHHARVKHIPQTVSRFVLGGTSTRDFSVEWPSYVKARDILRALYCPNPQQIKVKNEFEFCHAAPRQLVNKQAMKVWLKRRVKNSFAFRVYNRVGFEQMQAAQLSRLEALSRRIEKIESLTPRLIQNVDTLHDDNQKQVQSFVTGLAAVGNEVRELNRLSIQSQINLSHVRNEVRELQRTTIQSQHHLAGVGSEVRQLNKTSIQSQLNLAHVVAKVESSSDFSSHGFKVFSQWDEDGLIQHLVSRAGITQRTFVEIGVGDYSEANTRLLLQNNNWSGLIIDCETASMQKVRESELYWRYRLTALDAFVDADNVNRLLIENGMQGDIGLLSIDIDGVDYWVWKAINAVSPEIVICEYNGLFGSRARVTVPYDARFDRTQKHYSWLYAGASLAALEHLGQQKGYTLVGTSSGGNNAFFIRNDIFQRGSILRSARVYTRPMFRESRNPNGSLSYLDISEGIRLIEDLEVFDIDQQRLVKIADISLSYD